MGSLFLAAIPIDLNLLSRVPGTPVSITADGSQMTITEVVTQSASGTASFDLSSFANLSAPGLSFEMIPDLDLEDAGLDSFLTISSPCSSALDREATL